jgi:hypothetical protein
MQLKTTRQNVYLGRNWGRACTRWAFSSLQCSTSPSAVLRFEFVSFGVPNLLPQLLLYQGRAGIMFQLDPQVSIHIFVPSPFGYASRLAA